MASEVCGKHTLDGLAHTLLGVRRAVSGEAARFDRRAWQREYMRGYRARAKERADGGVG